MLRSGVTVSAVLTNSRHLRNTQRMSSCVWIRGTFFLLMTQWSDSLSLNTQGLPSDLLAAWPFLTLVLQSGSLEKKLNINLNVHVSECFTGAGSR